jgi:hypothetical protein
LLNVVKANLPSQPTNEFMHFFSGPVSELIDAVVKDHFTDGAARFSGRSRVVMQVRLGVNLHRKPSHPFALQNQPQRS